MTQMRMITILKITLGINFLWFGALKFFPGMSPAEALAINTIDWMFFGIFPGSISIKLLAIWEVAVGIALITSFYLRYFLPLLVIHLIFTFAPLVAFPEEAFTQFPYGLTLAGQYIVKNIVLIAVALFIYFDLEDR